MFLFSAAKSSLINTVNYWYGVTGVMNIHTPVSLSLFSVSLSVSLCPSLSLSLALRASFSHHVFVLHFSAMLLHLAFSPTGNDWESQKEMAPVGPCLARGVPQGHRRNWQRQSLHATVCECVWGRKTKTSHVWEHTLLYQFLIPVKKQTIWKWQWYPDNVC